MQKDKKRDWTAEMLERKRQKMLWRCYDDLPVKTRKRDSLFSEQTNYYLNIWKSISFIYTNSKQLENNWKTIPFTFPANNSKYPRIRLRNVQGPTWENHVNCWRTNWTSRWEDPILQRFQFPQHLSINLMQFQSESQRNFFPSWPNHSKVHLEIKCKRTAKEIL